MNNMTSRVVHTAVNPNGSGNIQTKTIDQAYMACLTDLF